MCFVVIFDISVLVRMSVLVRIIDTMKQILRKFQEYICIIFLILYIDYLEAS